MTDAATEALAPDRIYLLDYGTDQATWCDDPDPSGTGLHNSVEYVRSTPTPAGELREVVRAADYLIERYKDLWLGKSVRDLAEAHGAYDAAVARALAQPGSGEGV